MAKRSGLTKGYVSRPSDSVKGSKAGGSRKGVTLGGNVNGLGGTGGAVSTQNAKGAVGQGRA